jgi:hypothetical protein
VKLKDAKQIKSSKIGDDVVDEVDANAGVAGVIGTADGVL